MTLGQLAGHIANIPHWCDAVLGIPSSTSPRRETRAPKQPASVAALLADFDGRSRRRARGSSAAGDSEMLAPWTFKQGDREIFTMPRVAAIRSFVMNHLIHHRGQLSVYLRLKNVPLPSIYGPTADEQ